MRFEDRPCLVTGGSRGIGYAIAQEFAREGGLVGIIARDRERCTTAVSQLGEDKAFAIVADVSVPDDCHRAVAEFEQKFGQVRVLVNAAGISPLLEPARSHDAEAFKEIVNVNLAGPFAMSQAALPGLTATRGAIVMIASSTGLTASPRLVGYGASKAGMIQLTRTLAREWAGSGVRVNAVCPGYVETDLTREMLAREHLRARILEQTPMGRIGTLREIVSPTLFLASDEASYITGAALTVDGGMSA